MITVEISQSSDDDRQNEETLSVTDNRIRDASDDDR